MKRSLFLVSVSILVILGCTEDSSLPIAPQESNTDYITNQLDEDGISVYPLGGPGHNFDPAEDIESYIGRVDVYHDLESFYAVAGSVSVFDFQSLPAPGSSCCEDCADSGLAELHTSRFFGDLCLMSSPVCFRTEDPENTVVILEEEGHLRLTHTGQSIMVEYEGSLHGTMEMIGISTIFGFSARAPIGETAFLGLHPRDFPIWRINLTGTSVLHTLFVDDKWAEREADVVENMHLIADTFELFAVLAGGVYPTAAADATYQGDTLEYLLPDYRYPTNPFTGATTSFSWGAAPCGSSGAIGATTARYYEFRIQGRGKEAAGLLDTVLTSPPLEGQLARNMRTIQAAFETFAEISGGNYPTAENDTTDDGRRMADLLPGSHIPFNPYNTHYNTNPSPFSWNTEAKILNGAITAIIAKPDRYEIRGRGDDSDGYIDIVLTNE